MGLVDLLTSTGAKRVPQLAATERRGDEPSSVGSNGIVSVFLRRDRQRPAPGNEKGVVEEEEASSSSSSK